MQYNYIAKTRSVNKRGAGSRLSHVYCTEWLCLRQSAGRARTVSPDMRSSNIVGVCSTRIEPKIKTTSPCLAKHQFLLLLTITVVLQPTPVETESCRLLPETRDFASPNALACRHRLVPSWLRLYDRQKVNGNTGWLQAIGTTYFLPTRTL